MKISRVDEMRALDRAAIERYGIADALLMENAGEAAYFTILEAIGARGRRFVIFCGVGNNGGDGLVVARKLHSNGAQVTVFILGQRQKFKNTAKLNLEIAEKLGFEMIDLETAEQAGPALQAADAVVDAIFGTGLDREVGGKYREVIEMINASGKPVFAIDIPSGIHGDTGAVMGVAVRANHTITFGLPKIGLLLYPGFEHVGRLTVTHISFPPALYDADALRLATNDPLPLPPRPRDAHKGRFGKVLFIAGAAQYLGAPYFAALSFLKAGGGLSFLATPEPVAAFIGNKGSEIIFVPQKATEAGSIAAANKGDLLKFAKNVDMVVLGPGLSLHAETQALVRELAAGLDKPLLIDGDGLTAVAADPACLHDRTAPTVLTPHLGEMSRLTSRSMQEIDANKIDILQQTCEQLGAIIVLKGAHSLIGHPDGRVWVNLSGNPGMATAGSGDVLTGTIAAMYGLDFAIEDAVRMGVFVHGFAGDLAAQRLGEDGMLAGDILQHLPAAMQRLRQDFDSVARDAYGQIRTI